MSASEPVRRQSLRDRKTVYMTITSLAFIPYLASVLADLVLPANLFWLTCLSMIAIFVGAVGWARSLDEGAMSAHYIAWYWGGSLGLMVSVMVYMALAPSMLMDTVHDLARAGASANLDLGFHWGFMLGLLPAIIGYVIWWIALWARRGA